MADDCTFIQAGAGAVTRTCQDKMREISTSIADFSPAGSDWGAALQAAHDSLPTAGGSIDIPLGTFSCATSVTFTKSVTIRGKSSSTSVLEYSGSGLFINSTSTDYLRFENVRVKGIGAIAGPICISGATAYKAVGVVESLSADFLFWDTVSFYGGGFYHKHIDTQFRYFVTGFNNYVQNNLSFQNCRVTMFQNFVQVAGGGGPITFSGGSLENIAGTAFNSVSGGVPCVTITGAYFENQHTMVVPPPLSTPSGLFDNGRAVFCRDLPVHVSGCNIYLKGFKRFIDSSGAVGGACVNSLGNVFFFNNATSYDFVYYLAGTSPTGLFFDQVGDTAPATGKYINAVTRADGHIIYKELATGRIAEAYAAPALTELTPESGWTSTTTAGFQPAGLSYMLKNQKVILRGCVNGGSATSATICVLPADIRPAYYVQCAVCATNGTTYALRIGPNGNVLLDGISSGFPNGLGLDGVEFYIGV